MNGKARISPAKLTKQTQVEIAKKIINPISLLSQVFDFNQFQKLGCQVSYQEAEKLSPERQIWVVDLLKDNLYDLYSLSQWGWNESSKRKELLHKDSRFFIVTTDVGMDIAYCHFRFDMDYGRSVIYLYEIQVNSNSRAKGIGSALLCLIETLGKKAKMELLVLTCFKANLIARRFFEKHGLNMDKTNPPDAEEKDYVILSKRLQLKS